VIIRYSRRAIRDLEAIADYIRDRSPGAAERVRRRVEGLIGGLADFPYQGTPTDEPGIRRLVATPFPYLIFYRIKGEAVVILHIRHGRRRPDRLGQS
jgi:addiction module RelE/StbE family toxin